MLELEVFMHKQSQEIHILTHLCWKFKVRAPKNNSDNRKITAALYYNENLLCKWSIRESRVHKIYILYVICFYLNDTLYFVHICVKYLWY